MGRLVGLLVLVIVAGSLATGILFGLLALSSCEFLTANTISRQEIQFGVWRYSVNDPTNDFDTGGECRDLSELFAKDEFDWKYRTAQVTSIMAPCGGSLALVILLLLQCCCPIPFGERLMGLGYTIANLSTSLVWLVRTNEVCDTILGGCEWGEAASYLLLAQIAYIVAALFYRCLPDPKESRAERKRAKEQQANTANDDDGTTSANRGVSGAAAAAAAGGRDEANAQLQADLDRANQQIQRLEQENEANRKKLLAATTTTGTAAGVEAAQLKKANEKNAALEKELDAARRELSDVKSTSTPTDDTHAIQRLEKELMDLNEEHAKTQQALAIATAATAAEAAKLKTLAAENTKWKEQVQQAEREQDKAASRYQEEINEVVAAHEKTKKALAAATAASGTASAGEAIKIHQLQDQVDELQQELEKAKQAQSSELINLRNVTNELEQTKNALLIATAATGTAATAEAVEIRRLKEVLEQVEQEKLALQTGAEQYQAQFQSLEKENTKMKAALTAAAAATSTENGEAQKIEELEGLVEDLTKELEQAKSMEAVAADMLQKLEADNRQLQMAFNKATMEAIEQHDQEPPGTRKEEQDQIFQSTEQGEAVEVVDKDQITDDPPAATGDVDEYAVLRQENHILRAKLDMVKSEYAQKLFALEETETHIREDLAHKIDELHDKNEKRKEALAAATSHLNQDSVKLHKLRKENDALQDRIQELEEENEKQRLSLGHGTAAAYSMEDSSSLYAPTFPIDGEDAFGRLLDDEDGVGTTATFGQKLAFWSLAPAIVVVPLWLAMGRVLLGGPGGWNAILIMGIVDPFVVVLHIAIFVVIFVRNKQREDIDRLDEYFVTPRMSITVWVYYVIHFFVQILMDDGGDQGTMGSVAQKYLGVSERVAGTLTAILLLSAGGLLVALLVLACLEPTTFTSSSITAG